MTISGGVFAVFDWLANNKTAQAIGFALAVLFGLKMYGAKRERDGRKQADQAHEVERARGVEMVRKAVETIEQQSEERTDEAISARERVLADDDFRVSDIEGGVARRIFRD